MDVTGEAKQKINRRADPEQATNEHRPQQKNQEALFHQLSRIGGFIIVFLTRESSSGAGIPSKELACKQSSIGKASGLTYAFSQTSEL
jgi:hypothetical protein